MSKEDIIDKAIQKAEKNSGELHGWLLGAVFDDLGSLQDFAKALWGEELHHETFIVPKELSKRFAGTTDLSVKPIWQYHLQQIVIADDPTKYLGDNL